MTTNGLYPESQAERNQFHEWFREQWQAQVGQYFETPDRQDCFGWYRIAGWDNAVLTDAIDSLSKRCNKQGFDPGREWEHMIRFMSAVIINRTREKYGRVQPHRPDQFAKEAA